MKKSVRINLLVITTVVTIFAFAGIWYLRPNVPNELLEQARTRQLQPLLEIAEPMRKPIAESVSRTTVDKNALAQELLPTLTDQVFRSLEGPLYEKLKKAFASDEAFIQQISSKLEENLNLGLQSSEAVGTAAIPKGLQADFTKQMDALRSEVLAEFGEGQSSLFFQIEGMFDARLDRFEDDLRLEMQAYIPQVVDRMIPSLVEMLVTELETNKGTYLPYLAQELEPGLIDNITEGELLLLYTSYRDRIVADLVPAILTAMEEPAKKEVAEMVKTVKAPTPAVPAPPLAMKSVVTPVAMEETAPVVVAEPAPVIEPKAVIPTPPAVAPSKREVVKPEPILVAPAFATDEPEVFVDPVVYEQKRTEIRTKAIQEVLDRIHAL